MFQLRVFFKRGDRTVVKGVFSDSMGRGYDVELYDRLSLVTKREDYYKSLGIKTKVIQPHG